MPHCPTSCPHPRPARLLPAPTSRPSRVLPRTRIPTPLPHLTGLAATRITNIYLTLVDVNTLFQDQGVLGLPGLTNASDLPGQLAKLQADTEAFQVRFRVHWVSIFYLSIPGIRNLRGSWQSSRQILKRFRCACVWNSSLDSNWAYNSLVVKPQSWTRVTNAYYKAVPRIFRSGAASLATRHVLLTPSKFLFIACPLPRHA